MQQKQIQVGSNNLLVLDMPEGAVNISIVKTNTSKNSIEWQYQNDGGTWRVFPTYLTGEINILGLKDDITEEQWAEIVESEKFIRESGETDWYFKDYTSPHKMHELIFSNDNAKESGLSLLQANNCNYKTALIIRVI